MSDPNSLSLGRPHILSDTLKRLLATSNNEQAELQELNKRFANYIEKIRSLEKQNHSLEGELKKLQGSESKRCADVYNEEIEMLRNKLKTQNQHSSRLEIETDDLRLSLEKLTGEKEEAEKKLTALKEDMDAPTLASKVLEKEVEALHEEIAFQKKLHEEEILQLTDQLQETKRIDQFDGGNSDLTATLRDLREQFQNISTANIAETDEWYKSKMSEMNDTVNKNNEALKKVRQENNEFRHMIQNYICEISSLKGTNEALKNQIKKLMECHTSDVESLQDTITTLEEETNKMENDMESLLREYQDLQKVKVSLDVEIATYRKLLEGEESRIEPTGPRSDSSIGSDDDSDLDKFYEEY